MYMTGVPYVVPLSADGSDFSSKSQIKADQHYGAQKGIPAGRPGSELDMAQIALFLACNEYMYGQVSFICSLQGITSNVFQDCCY